MKQEDKELLLKDLCARLPYKTYGFGNGLFRNGTHVLTSVDDEHAFWSGGRDMSWSMKPMLFPLSCLTNEITVNGETFVPAIRIAQFIDNQHGHEISKVSREGNRIRVYTDKCDDIYDATINLGDFGPQFFRLTESVLASTVRRIDDFLLKNHINYRLPGHLFVPVTEEFNPYK